MCVKMDRLEKIRMEVDALLKQLHQESDRKFAYLHLYGVSQFATMLALIRKADAQLCAVAAMLHDISMYACNSGTHNHAEKSAAFTKDLLQKSQLFSNEEIREIVHAIKVHSNKACKEDGEMAEILKDADVLAHYLYNPNIPMPDKDRVRLYYVLETFTQAREETKYE